MKIFKDRLFRCISEQLGYRWNNYKLQEKKTYFFVESVVFRNAILFIFSESQKYPSHIFKLR